MTAKLKITFYTETYLVGGAERCLFDLANHIDHDRFDVSFWCNNNPNLIAAARQRIVPPIPISVVPSPIITTEQLVHIAQRRRIRQSALPRSVRDGIKTVLSYTKFAASFVSLKKLLARTRPDILHVNNGGYPGAQSCRAAILAAAQIRIPCRIMMVHNMAFSRSSFRLVEKWLDRRVEDSATRIITVSLASRDALIFEREFSPEKITNVYNGVPEYLSDYNAVARCRDEIGLDEITPLIGMVASFEPRKGHQYFLQALTEVIDRIPSTRAVLLGDGGGNEDKTRRLVSDLGLSNRVFFVGHRENVSDWMRACDVIVLPSTDKESLPYVILEAMAVGRPVVGTRIGGIHEEIEDGVTGSIVPPANTRALALAIMQILGDRDLAAQMGQAGRARVQRLFSMERMVRSLTELYESDFVRSV